MAVERLKICITGHRGFVGTHLKKYLSENKKLLVIPFEGDLLNKKDIENFFKKHKDINQVIHLVGSFFGDFENLYRANLLTTFYLLETLSYTNIKKIIYASSGAVYGEPLRRESKEVDMLFPNTIYGLTKLYAEESIKYFSNTSNIDYIILRFPNIYGEGNNKGVVFNMLNDIKTKRKITIYGDGNQSRNFLHVSDACKAVEKSIFYKKSNVFNISNPKKVKINDIIKILQKKYDFKIEYREENNKLRNLLLNTEKAKKELKFVPKVKELKI